MINKDKLNRFAFIIIFIYLSILNIVVVKTTPELIALQFAFLIFIFYKARFSKFVKDWSVFIALFMLYEFLRGISDNISPFYDSTLYVIYHLENYLFPILPTIYLQNIFIDNNLLIDILLLFYTMLFYYSLVVAFIIWLKREDIFRKYSKGFFILTFAGLLIFFLFPTAPPWFVSKELGIGIARPIYENTILKSFSGITLFYYLINGNLVAAFPSHHAAWPAFTTFFLIKHFKNKWLYLLLIIPLMIGFSVVVTGEHFLLDVLAGYLFAFVIINNESFKQK